MIYSLRKGRTSVYLQHAHTGHSISAEKYECQFVEGKAILRFSLRPVDENQRFDEEYLHGHPLTSVDVADSVVIDGLRQHLKFHREEIKSWELQILSRGAKLNYAVEPQIKEHSVRQILRFNVLVLVS